MKKNNLNATISFLGMLSMLLILAPGCAPVFSEMQSARTAGLNNIEITPSISGVAYSEDGETEMAQNHCGFQAAYGVTAKTDLRLRYEYIWLHGDKLRDGVSVIGFGPKFGLLQDKIAFYMPLGFALGKASDDYAMEMHPTMLFTIPVTKNKFELNFSTKYLMIMDDKNPKVFAFNFSPTFSDDFKKWCIRPEYGIMIQGGEKGFYNQFSLGVTYLFVNPKFITKLKGK